ncbi:MAG: 5'/3'-nucleotidase SurE [Aminivibrio sp.]|jgi:5'-nucleotidase|nr:5'/3'-nucleotidase SurE [Synergistaceae bacterium]
MKLLITNDDGVFAPGIIELASALSARGHECAVTAPDRERSSVGHSITLTRPLRLWEAPPGPYPPECTVYACDGTPSDCVVLGIEEIMPDPCLVVSGINRGPNLGDDLTYSGTVSAAMEGVILGRSSLALSLNCGEDDGEHHYETASSVAASMVDFLEANPLKPGVLLNINVPNVPLSLLRGVRVTRKGVRLYEGKVTRFTDPGGRVYYWVAGRPEDQLEEGSDVWAAANGYVSITPVHMDMTHFPSIEELTADGAEKINFK